MALGRRRARQSPLFVPASQLATSPGHPFYRHLEEVLVKAGFDGFVEELCEPYYAGRVGRPSIPPGTYFRMLMIGYFEGIDSQRGIAWRCSDSLSLREFLRIGPGEKTPDHTTLSLIRLRLPLEVFEDVFSFVLHVVHEQGVLKGKTVAVDSTYLEANAAMKSIVRKESGED